MQPVSVPAFTSVLGKPLLEVNSNPFIEIERSLDSPKRKSALLLPKFAPCVKQLDCWLHPQDKDGSHANNGFRQSARCAVVDAPSSKVRRWAHLEQAPGPIKSHDLTDRP